MANDGVIFWSMGAFIHRSIPYKPHVCYRPQRLSSSMIIKNSTPFCLGTVLKEAVSEYPTDGLVVEVKYCPQGSKRYISGTYYRRSTGYENGKLIRLRINRGNDYPV